jgi:hypothetical protein
VEIALWTICAALLALMSALFARGLNFAGA